jgi:hypothetical protein
VYSSLPSTLLVERPVVLVPDIALGSGPERGGAVDPLVHRLRFATGVLPGLAILLGRRRRTHLHRDGNVVGILLHQRAQPPVILVIAGILLEMQDHAGPARSAHDGLDGELRLTIAAPAHPLLGRQIGATALHQDAVGDQETGVETDPELADELGVLLAVAAQATQEFRGSGARDGAQVGDRLLPRHADAVVGDGDDMGLGIDLDAHPQLGVIGEQGAVLQRRKAQPVGGIRGVGDELAQEDIAVAVHRVDHQMQQALGFGLKPQGLGLGGLGHRFPPGRLGRSLP